jgi:hypothetical protein
MDVKELAGVLVSMDEHHRKLTGGEALRVVALVAGSDGIAAFETEGASLKDALRTFESVARDAGAAGEGVG